MEKPVVGNIEIRISKSETSDERFLKGACMSSRNILLVVLACTIVMCAGMLGGCKKENPAPAKPAVPAAPAEPNKVAAVMEQTTCPVMGGPVDKNIFVEYQGKKVYFCCSQCKAEFEKDPAKYVAKLPQFK